MKLATYARVVGAELYVVVCTVRVDVATGRRVLEAHCFRALSNGDDDDDDVHHKEDSQRKHENAEIKKKR